MEPAVIVGLGNPGDEYSETRHNVGFMVLEYLRARCGGRRRAGKGEFYEARCLIDGRNVLLIWPTTYMNNSGLALQEVLEAHPLPLENALIVYDDFALPLGTLRMRPNGSDGGHNGLGSIIYQIQTEEIPRLRCGIGRAEMPPKAAMADFVLSPFEKDEEQQLRDMIVRASDAIVSFTTEGIARAMTQCNSR